MQQDRRLLRALFRYGGDPDHPLSWFAPPGVWFMSRGASRLAIVPAETHASRSLTRITYEPADGSDAVTGVRAVARGLEHIHLG